MGPLAKVQEWKSHAEKSDWEKNVCKERVRDRENREILYMFHPSFLLKYRPPDKN